MKSENHMQLIAFNNKENKPDPLIPLSIAKKQFTSVNIVSDKLALKHDQSKYIFD